MSTGLECLFFEHKPGVWFYALEDWDSPKGGWDWRNHATAQGTSAPRDRAGGNGNGTTSNPGVSGTGPFGEGRRLDPVMDNFVAEAVAPGPRHDPSREAAQLAAFFGTRRLPWRP